MRGAFKIVYSKIGTRNIYITLNIWKNMGNSRGYWERDRRRKIGNETRGRLFSPDPRIPVTPAEDIPRLFRKKVREYDLEQFRKGILGFVRTYDGGDQMLKRFSRDDLRSLKYLTEAGIPLKEVRCRFKKLEINTTLGELVRRAQRDEEYKSSLEAPRRGEHPFEVILFEEQYETLVDFYDESKDRLN